MKRNKMKKSRVIFMATILAMFGANSIPELRVVAQETEHKQTTQSIQGETNNETVRKVFFPYRYTATGDVVYSDNNGANNYSRWTATVKSYLQVLGNGNFQRIEAINDKVVIEEFTPDYELVKQNQVDYELPIFGGYFCGEDYQFLVFGQSNDEESDDKEIMRIVKYDKEWKKMGSTSVCGANTTAPFAYGNLRMTEENGKLFIHTCHQMYTSTNDGLRHQANMTYVVSEEHMEVEQSWYEVMNIRYGYVSHSFNQFLIAEGGKLYRMDHGDAYPRSIVISKCDQSYISNSDYEEVWKIQGKTGDNTTGVSVGGFEKAGKYLVVVGNSNTQESEEAWSSNRKRNIFLTSTDANTLESKDDYWYDSDSEEVSEETTKKIWLTNYTATDAVSVKTPHLVKASDNLLYVMWEEENTETRTTTVKIVGVDAQGNKVTDVASIYGRLSDCKPIYESDGTIQWYTSCKEGTGGKYDWDENGNWYYIENSNKSEVIFYKVDTNRLGEYQFTEKFDFSEVEASLESNEFIYDPEKECEPTVVVTYKGAYLEEGRDFSVSYINNESLGQATVTLKGKECFSGSKELNFTIKPRDISGYTLIATPSSIVYDGNYHRPECSIYDGEKEVKVVGEYQNQSNYAAGVYTVTFSAIETYGYTGTLTTTYEITPKDLEEADISLRTSQFTYTGKEIEAVVTVRDDGRILSKDKDYTVTYENNIVAGEATILINGIGNYKGTRKITFDIVPASIDKFTLSGTENKVYTGEEIVFPLILKDSKGVELKKDVDYSIQYSNNINAGTATVVVSGIGNYTGSITKTFEIAQKTIEGMYVKSISSQMYTGNEIKIAVELYDKRYDGKLLVLDKDYICTYSTDCTNAGLVTVTLQGIGNYTGILETSYEIKPISIDDYKVSGIVDKTYTGMAIAQSIKVVNDEGKELVEGKDFSVEYLYNQNVGTAYVSVKGIGNYGGSIVQQFKINQSDITKAKVTLTQSSFKYDGAAKCPAVTIKNGNVTLIKDKDFIVTYLQNTAVGTAKVVVKGIGNYTGTVEKTFTIEKKTISTPSQVKGVAQSGSKTTSSATLKWNAISGVAGYEIYRASSKNGSYTKVGTTTGTSFTNKKLKSGTGYYYKVRAYVKDGKKNIYGSYSVVISAQTLPKAPTLKLTAGKKKVKASWKKISGCKGYEVYMATSAKGKYKKIKSTNAKTVSVTKTGLTGGKKYYFKVKSYVNDAAGKKVYSGYSAVKSVKVKK